VLDLGLVLAVDDSALFAPSLASLVQIRFPLQTNQILQEGFAFRCTVSAFLDLGARIFLV
jgi:hypothetical protein